MQTVNSSVTLNNMRSMSLQRLEGLTNVDVIVLGGGVNGAAVLRELALNGLSAVLIDTGDFCGGASGASSRMAHGGLRYLEGREFRLVAESTVERNHLITHAPHFVHPLEIVVPLPGLVSGFARSIMRFLNLSTRGGPLSLLALEGALRLYEYLGRHSGKLPRHSTTLRRAGFPKGMNEKTRAVTCYFDAQITQPEALVMEMLSEAVSEHEQVVALNHVIWEFNDDIFTLQDKWGKAQYVVKPRLVINATGAWIDQINAVLGLQTHYLRGVKGAHLVLNNAALFERMAGRAFYYDDGHGRMIITLPVGENILVGTTEVEVDEPDDSTVSPAEISYLLDAINGLFSDIDVCQSEIVSMTTGIRPLRHGSGGSATAAARDHAQEVDQLNDSELTVLSLVGGKWTTFRAFSEQAMDQVLEQLKLMRKVSTATRDYPGSSACSVEALCSQVNIDEQRAESLLARYGSFATEVAVYCDSQDDYVLPGCEAYSRAEIEWLIHTRAACTVEDLVLRRTQMTMGHGLNHEALRCLGTILVDSLDRDPLEVEREIELAMSNPRLCGVRARRQKAA